MSITLKNYVHSVVGLSEGDAGPRRHTRAALARDKETLCKKYVTTLLLCCLFFRVSVSCMSCTMC